MVAEMPGRDLPADLLKQIRQTCHSAIVRRESLKGGVISDTSRITLGNGGTYVLKACPSAPPDLYPKEADALKCLGLPGCPRVPRVIACSRSYLLLEDLGPAAAPTPAQWEVFGRQVARLHAVYNDRFGFDYDNYLGLVVQANDWCADGHAFFVQQRVLPHVERGLCAEILDRADRAKIDRVCARLGELVPSQPASLCHGDLWTPNILATQDGDVAYVDPALHYGWAEADLSLTFVLAPFPDAFYAAYQEICPLEADWRERMELYLLKEHLVTMAQFGNQYGSADNLRRTLDRYA